nr:MAG TPA: hypothetical protein [Caudoviricetes sp.]
MKFCVLSSVCGTINQTVVCGRHRGRNSVFSSLVCGTINFALGILRNTSSYLLLNNLPLVT